MFGWDISRIERETVAYFRLDQHRNARVPPLAPSFLAHLTENGRVIGMLLEKLEGEFATIDDLSACEEALCTLHRLGMTHGDVNRYNFILDRSKERAQLIDFEHAAPYEESEAFAELQSLATELAESTGRGGPAVCHSDA